MRLPRNLCRIFLCVTLATRFASAHNDTLNLNAASEFSFWDLPLIRLFSPVFTTLPEPPTLEPPEAPVAEACLVEPLPPIEDPTALGFEQRSSSSDAVDLVGLTRATARALSRFRKIVSAAGGSMAITSAYRPAAYQSHLQQVWDKWSELKDNEEPACQAMKAGVAAEFSQHQLLLSQRPVGVSDHTLGIGFDASVLLPSKKRGRAVDALARRAGVIRPNAFGDPVHFRLIGGRG